MKLIKTTSAGAQFFLNPTELQLLDSLLKKFPFTDHTPGEISRTGKDPQASERRKLLNESLKEHRRELARSAHTLLDADKLKLCKKGHLLTLNPAEREILLQILNDIRISCWHSLGEPEVLEVQTPVLTDQEFAWRNLMHLAGHFEHYLVQTEPED
jgi:hypothetical protein